MSKNMPDLYKLLGKISREGGEPNSFHTDLIPGQSSHAFGWDPSGYPTLLLRCSEKSNHRKDITQRALKVLFNRTCNIASPDGSGESVGVFTTITCLSAEKPMQKYFTFLCEAFLQVLGGNPSNEEIFDMIQNLIKIFRKLSQPTTQELNGLFGELYYISCTRSPQAAMAAWRLREGDKYDFWTEQACVEVKTCAARVREHLFAIDQCNPKTAHGLLVSMQIERIDVGLSFGDLQQRVAKLVANEPNLQLKLNDTVAQCLGDRLLAARDVSFDEGIAKESLRLYDLKKIPAIKLADVPRAVNQVKFASNLANIEDWAINDLKKIKALAGFLPKD